MTNVLKQITNFTMAIGATTLLSACTNTCGEHHSMPKQHHKSHGTPQHMMVYEAAAIEMVEMPPMPNKSYGMKAQMHTRNSHGGTSPMGHIKFKQDDDAIKMTVDVTDLRPDKDYTMKIYPCGNCNDYSCCSKKCMNVKLPTLSVDEPGRFTKTYKITGIDCSELQNAKVVLTRDGGYKASWGRIEPINQ